MTGSAKCVRRASRSFPLWVTAASLQEKAVCWVDTHIVQSLKRRTSHGRFQCYKEAPLIVSALSIIRPHKVVKDLLMQHIWLLNVCLN